VFCTGNDNPIEKFNSLLANTRFPWEEDEELEFVLPLGTVECWLKKKKRCNIDEYGHEIILLKQETLYFHQKVPQWWLAYLMGR
jgi:hypothetical protein